MDHLCHFCLSLCLHARLFIDVLWSPAGKGLTLWVSFLMSNCEVVTFPCGILGQVMSLIVSFPDLCFFSYFYICSCVVDYIYFKIFVPLLNRNF